MNAFVAVLVLAVATANAGWVGHDVHAVHAVHGWNHEAHIPSGSVSVGHDGVVIAGPSGSVHTDNGLHGHGAGARLSGPAGDVATHDGHARLAGPGHDHHVAHVAHVAPVHHVAHVAHVAPVHTHTAVVGPTAHATIVGPSAHASIVAPVAHYAAAPAWGHHAAVVAAPAWGHHGVVAHGLVGHHGW